MSPSKLRWSALTVAPWFLAGGMLVSFTASAGQDGSSLGGVAVLSREGSPLRAPNPAGRAALNALLTAPLEASVGLGAPGDTDDDDLWTGGPSATPRDELKASRAAYPDPDRGAKGDAQPRGGRAAPPHGIEGWLAPEPTSKLTGAFTPADAITGDGGRVASSFTRDTTTALRATQRANPEGTTPATPRALALASSTPAAADTTPVRVAAAPVSGARVAIGLAMSMALRADGPDPARYAGLIAPEREAREQRCLAEAVYFEARSEPEAGQAAVAQVVLNRVKSGLYPANVCGVVYQNRHRYLGCQFSFACEGKSLRITDRGSWDTAVRVAREVSGGTTYLPAVGAATHYHADYVKPRWSRALRRNDVVGRHVFYQLRPGQT